MNINKILLFCLTIWMVNPCLEAIAQGKQYDDWHIGHHIGHGMTGYFWGMHWFGMIFMFAIWVLVLIALIYLVKWLIQTTSGKKEIYFGSNKALEILKERFARGEIDKSEFESKIVCEPMVGVHNRQKINQNTKARIQCIIL